GRGGHRLGSGGGGGGACRRSNPGGLRASSRLCFASIPARPVGYDPARGAVLRPPRGAMRKYLIGTAAVLFPSLLLWPSGEGFALEWGNHVWLVGYFGEYFRQHLAMPAGIHTPEVGGLAYPVFYGYLLYPLLGFASARLHPEVVVRLAALLALAGQYVCV